MVINKPTSLFLSRAALKRWRTSEGIHDFALSEVVAVDVVVNAAHKQLLTVQAPFDDSERVAKLDLLQRLLLLDVPYAHDAVVACCRDQLFARSFDAVYAVEHFLDGRTMAADELA